MQEGADRFVGSMPDYYDRGLAPVMFEPYARLTAARLAEHSPSRVLETACGTGVLTRALLQWLPESASLTATDLNGPMLQVARRRCGESPRLRFLEANAEALPFADGAFDALVCQFGVMFFPQKDVAYREARRVLARGGRYLFSVWDHLATNEPTALLVRLLEQRFPRDPPRFFEVPFGYHSLDAIRGSLAAAGFHQARFDVLPVEAALPDRRAYAEGLLRGSPLADQLTARGADLVEMVEALSDALERKFGETGVAPLQAILVEARRD
jgi:SAM-dependent methyltransferase